MQGPHLEGFESRRAVGVPDNRRSASPMPATSPTARVPTSSGSASSQACSHPGLAPCQNIPRTNGITTIHSLTRPSTACHPTTSAAAADHATDTALVTSPRRICGVETPLAWSWGRLQPRQPGGNRTGVLQGLAGGARSQLGLLTTLLGLNTPCGRVRRP